MATTPTQLPVPSEKPQDLKSNAGKIDEFVTSLAMQYIDRLGGKHYTIEGLKQLALQQIYALGWNPVGTFQDGATIANPGDILQDETNDVWYRWDDPATLPKFVPADSTPGSTGGTGEGKWFAVDVSDVLKKQLATSSGAGLVGFGSETVESALSTLPTGKKVYDLIIVYGQSNAVGWAQDTPGFPTVIHDKALYFNPATGLISKIIKAMPSSSGQTSTGHGWASFANEYIRLTGRGVVVVNGAYGGMNIATLAKPATPGITLYDKLTAAVASAKSKMVIDGLPIGKIYAMWNQGEQDAADNTLAVTYRAALGTMIDNMVADFGVSKFLIQTLASCYNYTAEYKVSRIQQAQRDVARRIDALIISDVQTKFTPNNGLLQSSDNVHYTQRGYNVLGEQTAQTAASVNFDEMADVNVGLEQYGVLQTSGRRRTRLSHVRVKKSGGSWGVYSENDGTGSYTQQFVDGANLIANNFVQIPFLGELSPYYSGEFVTPNRAMQQFNLGVIGNPITIDAPNNIYGRNYQVFANLNFIVNSAGGMSVNGGSATQLAMVQGCVTASVSGSTVTLTLQGGACYQYPVATAFGTGTVTIAGTTTTAAAITFVGGSTGAIVNWPNVPVPLTAVPDGCEFSCVAFIGNSSD